MTQASTPTRPLLDIQAVKRAYSLVEWVAGNSRRTAATIRAKHLAGTLPIPSGAGIRSFSVSVQRQRFRCFGCGVHGDVVISCGCTSNLGRHRRRARG